MAEVFVHRHFIFKQLLLRAQPNRGSSQAHLATKFMLNSFSHFGALLPGLEVDI